MENTTTDTAAFPDAIQDQTIDTRPIIDPADVYDELIEHKLTEEDRDAKRKKLECVDREIIRLEEEKKAEAKVKNNQLKPLKAERESILETLDSGVEKRPTPCYEHVVEDSAGNILRIDIRRFDTHEVIGDRAATSEEQKDALAKRQGELFGDTDPPPSSNDASFDDDFEPEPEAVAQAAEDEGRIVKTNSRAARAKKQQREGADAE